MSAMRTSLILSRNIYLQTTLVFVVNFFYCILLSVFIVYIQSASYNLVVAFNSLLSADMPLRNYPLTYSFTHLLDCCFVIQFTSSLHFLPSRQPRCRNSYCKYSVIFAFVSSLRTVAIYPPVGSVWQSKILSRREAINGLRLGHFRVSA